jgi:hypothetical protein
LQYVEPVGICVPHWPQYITALAGLNLEGSASGAVIGAVMGPIMGPVMGAVICFLLLYHRTISATTAIGRLNKNTMAKRYDITWATGPT